MSLTLRALIKKEIQRQKSVVNLIASENYPSEKVLAALATPLAGKYAEGKSHQRYYAGNTIIDQIEDAAQHLARKAFAISETQWRVNVQPYSGSIANLAAYLGACELGDSIVAMSLEHGGHLTHGHSVSLTGKLFKFSHYGVTKEGYIDYDQVLAVVKKAKPKIVVCGATAYPRIIDFKKFRAIADSVDALLMADVSHIAGLIVGGVHPSPFPYVDIVTTTTHKTLRGPRGAIIFTKEKIQKNKELTVADGVDKAIFPGLQGGPHMHTIAAMGVALEEALTSGFRKYAERVVSNANVLAGTLIDEGLHLVTNGTDNHLMLIDLTPLGCTGKQAADILEKNGIIVNKNMIPYDVRKPWDPSGIRLGTPAVTTQGMREKDMRAIAKRISTILKSV